MRLLPVLTFVVLALPGSGATANLRYRAWQWQRVIEPVSSSPADEQCVVLDADLYHAASPGLRDIRLLQDGREVAYALQESYDERALQAGPLGREQADRSLYTTVLQIPLHGPARMQGTAGSTVEQGAAVLAQRVPVERIELVADAGSDQSEARDAMPVHLRLLATPDSRVVLSRSQSLVPEGELIEDELDGNHPVEMTAIGANLQSDALVSVTAASAGKRFLHVLLQMHQRSICYQPMSSAPLLMFYGNANARPPRYVYSTHFQPTAAPLFARLGTVQANPSYRRADVTGFTLTRLQRLSLAIFVAVAGFLLTAIPLLRRR